MESKYKYLQHILITVHGLNYNGRINRIIFDGGPQLIYSVNYVKDGDLHNNEFYEDELSAFGDGH